MRAWTVENTAKRMSLEEFKAIASTLEEGDLDLADRLCFRWIQSALQDQADDKREIGVKLLSIIGRLLPD